MKHTTFALMATLMLSGGVGCTQAQSVSVTNLLSQVKSSGKQSAAAGIAASAVTAQQTLYYLASALSQAASIDLQGENLAPIGAFGSTAEISYVLDTVAGTGKVTGIRGGKQVVDLSFTYEKEHGNAGMAYTITGTSGSVEGYQMFFPRLTLLYTALLNGGFQPMRNSQGDALFNVSVEAIGSFGVEGIETMRLSKTTLNLTYPLTEGESKVGSLLATSNDGTRFEGELLAANKAFKLKGAIRDPLGRVTHQLETNAKGEASLQLAHPPEIPPAPVAP